MTAIERAIREARGAGWNNAFYEQLDNHQRHIEIAYCDPLFWQALGKARGWPANGMRQVCSECGREPEDEFCNEIGHNSTEPIFLYKWQRFINHLAARKDAESFFQTLV